MSAAILATPSAKRPWHLWLVAVLSLLWNLSGAVTIMMAQAGTLQGISADEAAYYAAQPTLFVILTDLSLVTAMLGAVALLCRARVALWLYGISLVSICVTNTWDLLAGTSRALATTGALVVTCVIFVLAILQVLYARALLRRGLLR